MNRSDRVRAAILTATLELLAEQGFAGFTVDGVAARAGVGKATIYRHWGSRNALALDAISHALPAPACPDSGDVREDLRVLGRSLVRILTRSPVAAILPSLVDASARDPELRDLHRTYLRDRRKVLLGVLRRGVERGELRDDADVELLADMLAGALFYRRLLVHAATDGAYVDGLVDAVVGSVTTGAPATTG